MLAIDIGSRYIKIACGSVQAKNINIQKQISILTPENSVVNGIVSDGEKVAEAIRKAATEHKLKGKKAAVVLNSPNVVIREIKLPKTSKNNMDAIVFNEMEPYLGGEAYSVEYFLQTQGDGTFKAFIFALPVKTVGMYKKLLLDAGLVPCAFDVSANSIRKLLSMGNVVSSEEQCLDIVADVGYHFINFNIFQKQNLLYSRCVRIDVTEQMKEYVDSLGEKTRNDLEMDIDFTAYLSTVGDEIQKILQFLLSSELRDNKTKLFLIGGAANFDGISYLLSEYLSKEVFLIESKKNRSTKEWNLKEYANALGALIRL